VIRTRVGYAGGTKPSPTYRTIGDHTETLQIDFDPQKISYTVLLDLFWEYHDAFAPAYSRQYRSLILYADDEQKQQALASKEKYERMAQRNVYTAIEPLSIFTLAENYHQKYYLRQRSSLMRDLLQAYPTEAEFINATLSARMNAVAAGLMDKNLLAELLSNPVLSDDTKQRLSGNRMRI
jgi:peptide-methionine (S)-S-oxide reductase